MSAIELVGIRKDFASTSVLKGVDLSIASGEFVSLLGPSGCGKTTLLRVIAGLESATGGSVIIAGRDATRLPPEKRDIAMVFQSYALLPHLTVQENVRFPLRMRRAGGRAEQEARVREALEVVRLGHLADRRPRQLSGGQQQRVAMARAIVSRPQVLLMDEPLSNLDARLRESMQEELIQLHRQLGLTTVFVTHDQEEALSLSDRVVLLNGGRIEQQGSARELYARPRTRFAAEFMGSANILDVDVGRREGQVYARLPDGEELPLRCDIEPGSRRTVMIRQEDVALSPQDANSCDGLRGVVVTRVFLGTRTRYVVRVGNFDLRCLCDAQQLFDVGEKVHARVSPEVILPIL